MYVKIAVALVFKLSITERLIKIHQKRVI